MESCISWSCTGGSGAIGVEEGRYVLHARSRCQHLSMAMGSSLPRVKVQDMDMSNSSQMSNSESISAYLCRLRRYQVAYLAPALYSELILHVDWHHNLLAPQSFSRCYRLGHFVPPAFQWGHVWSGICAPLIPRCIDYRFKLVSCHLQIRITTF